MDFVAHALSVFAFNVDFVSVFLSVDRAERFSDSEKSRRQTHEGRDMRPEYCVR